MWIYGIWMLYVMVLIRIAFCDFRTRRIPDREIGLLFGIGLLLLVAQGTGVSGTHLFGAFVISGPMLVASLLYEGAFGGGDIKLMAAAGFCQGCRAAALGFALGITLAGIFATFMLISGRKTRKEAIAFGPFLCLGLIGAIFCIH